MITVRQSAANTQITSKIKDAAVPGNVGKHYVTGPREAMPIRNRVFFFLSVGGTLVAVYLDTLQTLDCTADIDVIPLIQLEVKFWV